MAAKKEKAEKEKGKKPRPPRRPPVPPEVSSARKYRAWELRTLHPRMSFKAITDKLNEEFPDFPLKSEHQAVEKMIKEAEKEYIQEHKNKVDAVKAEAAIALEWARSQNASAWEQSIGALKVVKKRAEKPIESSLKESVGDPRFLKNFREDVIAIAKLFGAVAPQKHELTGKDGAPLTPPPAAFDLRKLGKYLTDGDLEILYKATEVIERAQRDLDAAVEGGARSTETEPKP